MQFLKNPMVPPTTGPLHKLFHLPQIFSSLLFTPIYYRPLNLIVTSSGKSSLNLKVITSQSTTYYSFDALSNITVTSIIIFLNVCFIYQRTSPIKKETSLSYLSWVSPLATNSTLPGTWYPVPNTFRVND